MTESILTSHRYFWSQGPRIWRLCLCPRPWFWPGRERPACGSLPAVLRPTALAGGKFQMRWPCFWSL